MELASLPTGEFKTVLQHRLYELKKAKQKGVKIRVVAPITKDNKDKIKNLKKFAEIRNSNYNGRFVLIDNKEILFMLMGDKEAHPSYDVGVWVKTKIFASLFNELFEEQYLKMPVEK